jgi:peptidoglycan/xylan/chitin deacetylase (PgdA/CDA1 family)
MGRICNLTFHGIGARPPRLEDGEADVWLDVASFGAVLDEIKDRADVRLTFDDGNASDIEIAVPELRCRGLKATFFIVAGRLGQPGYVSQEDARAIVDAGMSIGSHGQLHRPWRGLDDAALAVELADARVLLESAIGAAVRHASCPMGAYDRRVLAALRRCGYQRVYTSDRGCARSEAWLQPRSSLHRHAPHEELAGMLSPSAVQRPLLAAKRLVKRWR